MKLTADTITDEQISEVYRIRTAELEALDDSDAAGIAAAYQDRAACHVARQREFFERDPLEVHELLNSPALARARCADLWNTRHAKDGE